MQGVHTYEEVVTYMETNKVMPETYEDCYSVLNNNDPISDIEFDISDVMLAYLLLNTELGEGNHEKQLEAHLCILPVNISRNL